MKLTAQQQAAVDNRGGELLVSAAAGSGKTRILVERLLNRVEQERIDLDRFLVITYTKAAAAELRGKVMDELNVRLAQRPDDAFLRRQRAVIYRTQISTIHAFCTVVLREDGYRISLEPDFRVADDAECVPIRDFVLERMIEDHFDNIANEPDFSALVDTMSNGRDDQRLRGIILSIYTHIQSHPDPEQWLKEKAEEFRLENVRGIGDTVWGEVLLTHVRLQVQYWMRRMEEGVRLMQYDDALYEAYGDSFAQVLDQMEGFEQAIERGWDAVRDSFVQFPRLKSARKVEDAALKEQVKSIWDTCKKRMQKLEEILAESEEEAMADMRLVAPAVVCLHELVWEFTERFSAEKRRRNLVDFSDLEHLTLQLLNAPDGETSEVARRWAGRFVEVMVDEYQDTNQVQNEIFNAISNSGRHLFQVGDVKQSIYRFRLADPTIFLGKYNSYSSGEEAKEGEPRKLVLSYNFRSRASVLEGVNYVFENIMSVDAGEMEYTADQRLYPQFPYREQPADLVELDVVDMSELEWGEDEEKARKDEIEVDFVARRIRELLDSEFPITDGDGFRPVVPEDICILYRAPNGVMNRLTAALDRNRIPWSSDGTGDFFATEEISTVLAFLEVIDNPRQDIPLLSVLMSPIYDFSGSELAILRGRMNEAGNRDADLYECILFGAEQQDSKCISFLNELGAMRSLAVDMSGHKILQEIYDRTGAIAIYGAMDGGEMRQGNLQMLFDYACKLESAGHRGVFGLVNHFRKMKESGQTIGTAGQEKVGGVRIMSIHKSKGLEFPIVMLAGLSHQFNTVDTRAPVLFHSKLGVGPKGLDLEKRIEYPTLARQAVALQLEHEMKAEEMRLLYVAMTRAREKLIMVYADQNWSKKCQTLAAEAGPKIDPEAINGKNCMGDWVLMAALARPEAHVLSDGSGVSGEIAPTIDRWDIRLVSGEKPTRERKKLGMEGEAKKSITISKEDRARLDWRYYYQKVTNLPSKATATQLKGRMLDREAAEGAVIPRRDVRIIQPRFDAAKRGVTAAQAGTAMHTVMQLIRLDQTGSVEKIRKEVERLVDIKCLTEAEGKSVNVERIAAFFQSPLGQEMLCGENLRREFKFSVLVSANLLSDRCDEYENLLVQGVIDCCYQTDGEITVIDFKTDRVKPGAETEHSQRYLNQLDIYSHALSEMMNRPVRKRYLWYFATDTAVEMTGKLSEFDAKNMLLFMK